MKQQNNIQQTGTERSARSQRSWVEEKLLRDKIERLEAGITQAEGQIVNLETRKAELVKLRGFGSPHANDEELGQKIAEIANTRGAVEAYKAECAEIQLQIGQALPTAAQAQTRVSQQQEFTKLADARLELDRKIDKVFAGLRTIIGGRKELSAQMAKCASDLDLTFPDDGLDAGLGELLGLLPQDVSGTSRTFCDWFLGRGEESTPYVVIDESLEVRETLLDFGIYHFGERILLRPEEAAPLLRTDRAVKERRYPYQCLAPSLLSVEDYEAAVAAAKRKGISLQEVLRETESKRADEGRNRFDAEKKARDDAVRDLTRIP
jgi:hypothetical protein